MLKDDAIRMGHIEPTEEDMARMNLTEKPVATVVSSEDRAAVPPVVPDELAKAIAAEVSEEA